MTRIRAALASTFLICTALPTSAVHAEGFDVDHASVEELKKRNALLEREKGAIAKRLNALTHKQGGAFERGAEKLYPSGPDKPAEDVQKVSFCNQDQRLFIRADSLDNFLYTAPTAADAQGASVSYTDDRIAKTRTLAVQGQVSYVLFRDLCPPTPIEYVPFISGWAVVPFVAADGDFTSPRSKNEQSSAKIGVETQFELSRGLSLFGDFPLRQVFTFAPYYQSDFRGEARAYGFNGYWDAYDLRYHLGGYLKTDPYLGWFVQLRGEADIRQVDIPGVTGLSKTNYEWAGATARLTFNFLPSADVPDWLLNRFSFIATAKYFHDFNSGMDVNFYQATLKYRLNPYSSIGLEYTNGTTKESLVYAQKYMIKLLYAE
ncbi:MULTISPECIES: hypothetical protein [unclassified Bradyrhizobium]|uniref:hypothetical protein n=1 Tax=Bradyrhizobium sp. USDA 4541 TaxID=2817704 RepID=UPI0020A3A96D|nr:hypothetical protein [Bradyrhizobium sp. USDA 4541]MCP1854525.1 hypothetical protein [Bradyrhizobium sp. USDA 4541]